MSTTKTIVSKDILERLLDTEKLKYCYECGICTASCPMAELLGKDYNPRELLEKIVLDPEGVLSCSDSGFARGVTAVTGVALKR